MHSVSPYSWKSFLLTWFISFAVLFAYYLTWVSPELVSTYGAVHHMPFLFTIAATGVAIAVLSHWYFFLPHRSRRFASAMTIVLSWIIGIGFGWHMLMQQPGMIGLVVLFLLFPYIILSLLILTVASRRQSVWSMLVDFFVFFS